MNLPVKKLNPDAVIPKYEKQGDSGFDLVAVEDVIIEPGEMKLIKTGLAFDIPKGFEIQVRPRSGITLKTKLRVQLGTIDSNYRGEVGVIVDNISKGERLNNTYGYYRSIDQRLTGAGNSGATPGAYYIYKGDRIAQAILAPVAHSTFEEVDELSGSERGTNGYGSTGIRR